MRHIKQARDNDDIWTYSTCSAYRNSQKKNPPTNVLGTLPLVVIFLLCFSLANLILCLAAISVVNEINKFPESLQFFNTRQCFSLF